MVKSSFHYCISAVHIIFIVSSSCCNVSGGGSQPVNKYHKGKLLRFQMTVNAKKIFVGVGTDVWWVSCNWLELNQSIASNWWFCVSSYHFIKQNVVFHSSLNSHLSPKRLAAVNLIGPEYVFSIYLLVFLLRVVFGGNWSSQCTRLVFFKLIVVLIHAFCFTENTTRKTFVNYKFCLHATKQS